MLTLYKYTYNCTNGKNIFRGMYKYSNNCKYGIV